MSESQTVVKRSIRMTKCGDDTLGTLNGYVFAGLNHAREWLSQSFVDRRRTKIEEVEVGEPRGCPHCNGTGQVIKPVRKLTVDEFLSGASDT